MTQQDQPPPLPPAPSPLPPLLPGASEGYRAGPIRRAGMLGILTAYILAMLVLHGQRPQEGPALPGTTGGLLATLGIDMLLFGAVFGLAFWLGRPRRVELYSGHGPTLGRWILGFVWALAVRFGVGFVVVGVLAVVRLFRPSAADSLQPEVANVLPFKALMDPVYLLTVCTVVSFVVAGLREELWRAGMIFALASLLPGGWRQRSRELLAVGFAAVVFGAGHSTQGAGGMVLTGVLGLFLGLIMVLRRSLWEAVLAHGFFDATTFLMLRVLVDKVLLHDWLTRMGIPEETIRQVMEELAKRIGV